MYTYYHIKHKPLALYQTYSSPDNGFGKCIILCMFSLSSPWWLYSFTQQVHWLPSIVYTQVFVELSMRAKATSCLVRTPSHFDPRCIGKSHYIPLNHALSKPMSIHTLAKKRHSYIHHNRFTRRSEPQARPHATSARSFVAASGLTATCNGHDQAISLGTATNNFTLYFFFLF